MAITMQKGKIPFNKEGNLINGTYYQYWTKDEDVIWKDNIPFKAAMLLLSTNDKNFRFKNMYDDGLTDMFPTEFNLAIPYIDKGMLVGMFSYVKRGKTFGLVFTPEVSNA